MTYTVLYRDNGSIIGNHADRDDAVRDAVSIALVRPDLSLFVGLIEVGEDGMPTASFVSASDLLATADPVAVATSEAYAAAEGDAETEDGESRRIQFEVKRTGSPPADIVIESAEPRPADVVVEDEASPWVLKRDVSLPPMTASELAELVEAVAAESGLSKKAAGSAIEAVMQSIGVALGETVSLTFHVSERGSREGRSNPGRRATTQIAASKVPRFTAGSGLKKSETVGEKAPSARRTKRKPKG